MCVCVYLHFLGSLGQFLGFSLRVGVLSAMVLLCLVCISTLAVVRTLAAVALVEARPLVLGRSLHCVLTLWMYVCVCVSMWRCEIKWFNIVTYSCIICILSVWHKYISHTTASTLLQSSVYCLNLVSVSELTKQYFWEHLLIYWQELNKHCT